MLINKFIPKNFVRYCSYKPIKRVNLNSTPKKAYVEKKLKEFDLEKVLRSKIEVSGPLTGNLIY